MHDFTDAASESADRDEDMNQVRVAVRGDRVRRPDGRLLPGHGHTPRLQPVSGVFRQTSLGPGVFHIRASFTYSRLSHTAVFHIQAPPAEAILSSTFRIFPGATLSLDTRLFLRIAVSRSRSNTGTRINSGPYPHIRPAARRASACCRREQLPGRGLRPNIPKMRKVELRRCSGTSASVARHQAMCLACSSCIDCFAYTWAPPETTTRASQSMRVDRLSHDWFQQRTLFRRKEPPWITVVLRVLRG